MSSVGVNLDTLRLAARFAAHACPSAHSRSSACPVCAAARAWASEHRRQDLRAVPGTLRPLVLRAREDATLIPPSPSPRAYFDDRSYGALTRVPGVDAPDHRGDDLSDMQSYAVEHLEDCA